MPETYDQYKQRVLQYLGDRDPLEIQRATASELAGIVAGVPREALEARPAPGKWSSLEILAHLADTELVVACRLRFMLARPGAPLLWFDEDDWARRFRYQDQDPRVPLELFRAVRDSNIRLLGGVPNEQWGLARGVHETRGVETLADCVKMIAAHDLNHLRQIAVLLARPA